MEELGLKAVEGQGQGRASERVLADASAVPAHIQSLEETVSSFLIYQRFRDEAQS